MRPFALLVPLLFLLASCQNVRHELLVHYVDQPIESIVTDLSQQTGLKIIISQESNTKSLPKVSLCNPDPIPLKDVLRFIATQTDTNVFRLEDGTIGFDTVSCTDGATGKILPKYQWINEE